MLSLLWVVFISFFFLYWEVGILSTIIMLVLSFVNFYQLFSYVEMIFGMGESVSKLMIMLSVLLCYLSVLCSPKIKSDSFLLLILFLGSILTLAFYMHNIIMFYVFFEFSLIPTLMLIVGWGYQPERLEASIYMMIYTVGASLPLLLFLNKVGLLLGSFNLYLIQCSAPFISSFWWVMAMGTAFLVKLPMYIYHLWLPKAHVEAPLVGSMILAGVLLKLGGYGLYLMFKLFNMNFKSPWILLLTCLGLCGGLLSAFLCLYQDDMKSFVAYSSVAHMSLIIMATTLNSTWGIVSLKVILLAHGFTSPALFLLAFITYMKSNSRSLLHSGGMLVFCPILGLIWFLLLSINMAAPPTLNLLGELMIIPVLWSLSKFIILLIILLVLFSVIYNMFFFTSISHGGVNKTLIPSGQFQFTSLEFLGAVSHMLPLFMIFKLSFFL